MPCWSNVFKEVILIMGSHGSHRMRRPKRTAPKSVRMAQVEKVSVLTNGGKVIKLPRRRAERMLKAGKLKKILG